MLARLGQGNRRAAAARPSGAADAVQVDFRRRRHVVVDDVGEVLDVESAGGDIGRNQQVGLLRPEQAHDAIALTLNHSAVQRFGLVSVRMERLDERIDLEPGAAEHQRRDRILHVEEPLERRRLVGTVDDIGDLADPRQLARRLLLAGNRNPRRILQVPIGNRQNPARHGRREECRLARLRAWT